MLNKLLYIGCASAILFLSGCQVKRHAMSDKDVFYKLLKITDMSKEDWSRHTFKIEQIQPYVIIAPKYSAKLFAPYVKSIVQVSNKNFPIFEIETNQGKKLSLIQVGAGAGNTHSAVLALVGTCCERILFIGSASSISTNIGPGDIIIPSASVSERGKEMYQRGKRYESDFENSAKLTRLARSFAQKHGVQVVNKKVFSTSKTTPHIQEMHKSGCEAFEMETAMFFNGVEIIDRKAAALLYVANCPKGEQSSLNGFTEASETRKFRTKNEIIPQVALEFFQKD